MFVKWRKLEDAAEWTLIVSLIKILVLINREHREPVNTGSICEGEEGDDKETVPQENKFLTRRCRERVPVSIHHRVE